MNLRQNEEKDDFKVMILERKQDHSASDGGGKTKALATVFMGSLS